MSNIAENSAGGNTTPPPLEPDDERLKRQLVSALRQFAEVAAQSRSSRCIRLPHFGAFIFLHGAPPTGMMPLDVIGYDYLRRLGFSRADVRRAVNKAHRAGLVEMVTREGVSYVGLTGREARQ